MDQVTFNSIIDALAVRMAYAIALAEGFFVEGSLPQRINNPGDMKLGDRGWSTDYGKTVYLKADPAMPVSLTFVEMATVWTGNDNPGAWAKIVCAKLEVDPTMTICEWVKSQAEQGETE